MAWYTAAGTEGLLIVEDQLSAMRAADYLSSVALLGTNLNEDRAAEIKAAGIGNVYIALDDDAWDKTLGYAIKYRSYLKLIPLRLSKDIKNMNHYELQEWVLSNNLGDTE